MPPAPNSEGFLRDLEAVRFALDYELLKDAEGKGVNTIPWDKGGETAWGISSRYWRKWFEDRGIAWPPVKQADRDWFFGERWREMHCHEIADDALRAQYFLFAVVAGDEPGVRVLQCALRNYGPVKIDGVWGGQTLRAVAQVGGRALDAFKAAGLAYLTTRDDWDKAASSWLRRFDAVR